MAKPTASDAIEIFPFPTPHSRRRRGKRAGSQFRTVAGIVLALLFAEISLRPWAGQLYRFDAQPVSLDRRNSDVRTVRFYDEGIATTHFTPSRARLTGAHDVPGAPYIVVLGDSFVEALQVNDSQTMGSEVIRQAQKQGLAVNVRQYGWSGASPPKYALEAPAIQQLWSPSMVVVVANTDDFTPEALNTHWTQTVIQNGRATTQPQQTASPASVRYKVWKLSAHSALLETVIRRFALDVMPTLPRFELGKDQLGAISAARQDNGELTATMVKLLKDAYGDRLFLLYAADVGLSAHGPDPEELELLHQCAIQSVRCASSRQALEQARDDLKYIGRGFSNTSPGTGHYNSDGHRALGEIIWAEYLHRSQGGQ